MASIRVAVNGAAGKMGRETVGAICREADLDLVGAIDQIPRDKLDLPDELGTIPLYTNLAKLIEDASPQVLVDFTRAEVTMTAVPIAARHGVSLVIGTTGLTQQNLEEMESVALRGNVGILVAPNFALGAVLMMHVAEQIAPFFDYADIIEMHHEAKIDAPSGTSLAMAKAISKDKQFKRNRPQKETISGTTGGEYDGIGIHSVRLPGRSAHHEIIFGTSGQTVSLRHDVLGRDCYMPGVVRAIREVVNLKGLVVGLDKILGL